jgi:chromosome segregation ATPase
MDALLSVFYPAAISFLLVVVGFLIKKYITDVDASFKNIKSNMKAYDSMLSKHTDSLKDDIKNLKDIVAKLEKAHLEYSSKNIKEINEIKKFLRTEVDEFAKSSRASKEDILEFKEIISELKLNLKDFENYKKELIKKINLNKTSIAWINKDYVRIKDEIKKQDDLVHRSVKVIEKVLKKKKEG